MGTQRQKAEHAMFESHFERRASSTKRVYNARAKTCAEDHATPFGDSAFVPSSHVARAQIDEKSFEIRQKSTPDRPQIDKKLILSRFGRPMPFWGRVRTRSGWLLDAQMPPQSRSWDAPGEPRVARNHPKSSPGRPEDAPRLSRWAVQAFVQHRTASNTSSDRFLVALV